jgi:hypothetical protein
MDMSDKCVTTNSAIRITTTQAALGIPKWTRPWSSRLPYSYAIDNRRVHWGRLDAGWYGKSIISASASAGILVGVVINAYPDDKLY